MTAKGMAHAGWSQVGAGCAVSSAVARGKEFGLSHPNSLSPPLFTTIKQTNIHDQTASRSSSS